MAIQNQPNVEIYQIAIRIYRQTINRSVNHYEIIKHLELVYNPTQPNQVMVDGLDPLNLIEAIYIPSYRPNQVK